MLKIGFSKPEPANTGTLVVGILEDRKLTPAAQALDKKTGGVVTRAMTASRFKGRKEETLEILAVKGLPVARVLLIGLGKPEQLEPLRLQMIGGSLVGALNRAARASRICRSTRCPERRSARPTWRPTSRMARGCAPIASTSTARARRRSRSPRSRRSTCWSPTSRRRASRSRRSTASPTPST
jgi:leucyl aminopeptidase